MVPAKRMFSLKYQRLNIHKPVFQYVRPKRLIQAYLPKTGTKKTRRDTCGLAQYQLFILPILVPHEPQAFRGIILIVAEVLDAVAIGVKKVNA